jgi:hypothetical protein
MSEPKRYIFRIRECGCVKPEHLEGKYAPSALIIEETEGRCGWVSYEDYDRLKAEVERLTEAGDEMAFHYHQLELRVGNYSFSVKAPSIQAWEKAKEVQS